MNHLLFHAQIQYSTKKLDLLKKGGLLDNYISDLMERKDLRIIYAMILDPKGKVIAHNSMIEVGNSYQDELTERILNSRNTLIQFKPGDLVDISTPLLSLPNIGEI